MISSAVHTTVANTQRAGRTGEAGGRPGSAVRIQPVTYCVWVCIQSGRPQRRREDSRTARCDLDQAGVRVGGERDSSQGCQVESY